MKQRAMWGEVPWLMPFGLGQDVRNAGHPHTTPPAASGHPVRVNYGYAKENPPGRTGGS